MFPTKKDAILATIEWLKQNEPKCCSCDHCEWSRPSLLAKKQCKREREKCKKEHIKWEQKISKYEKMLKKELDEEAK